MTTPIRLAPALPPVAPTPVTRDLVAWLRILLALRENPAADGLLAILDLATRDGVSTAELAELIRGVR